MNLTVKRCLLGLVAPAAMFGMVWAQESESIGTVQLGRRAQAPVQVPEIEQIQGTVQEVPNYQPGVVDFGPSAAPSMPAPRGPGQPGYGNYFRVSAVDQVMTPRFTVDSRGGGLYGYNAGYSNIGVFMPYKIDDTSILFATGLGLVTYDGRGGATVGGGWRHWMEDIDRIIGVAGFYDFDNGHAKPYQQLGLSLESLGRYVDYRINGYLPVSSADHVLNSSLVGTAALFGNGIGLLRTNTVEQAFSGLDAEMGGPTPFLGRYGLNAYLGGYYYMGSGANAGSFTGVSGRIQAQINEDVSFGVQVTNDHMFGLNTQFQVFMNIPNGRPGRWMRNLRVQDKLVQNVFRQNRVVAKTETYSTYDAAINPNTHQAYFVANIDPNATTNGDGSVNNPFSSIANYEAVSVAQQQRYDIILVRPNINGTHDNLDTKSTLNVYSGQQLLSTTVQQTFVTENLPGITLPIPGFTGGAAPILYNSSGGDVITLVGGNTKAQQVSGFDIVGSSTGNGIFGNNNTAVNISNNTIEGGLNGVKLTNLSGTISGGTQAQFFNNTIQNNINNGIQITNNGSPPSVPNLEVIVQNNTFKTNGGDGLRIDALAGSKIGGLIGGLDSAATSTSPAITRSNTFDGNLGNGLNLTANGGTLDFQNTATSANGIVNNTFVSNVLDGLHIDSTNNSNVAFSIFKNTFGSAADSVINSEFGVKPTSTHANHRFGIGLVADSGTTVINIGGATSTNPDGSTFNPGNSFYANDVFSSSGTKILTPGNAVDFAVTGTSVLTYNLTNNLIKNTYTLNAPPPIDQFTFTFTGTSGTDPFTLQNLSTALAGRTAATITGMTWDLSSSASLLAPSGPTELRPNPVVIQPAAGDNLLASVNNVAVQTGTSPLTVAAAGALPADNANLGMVDFGQQLKLGFNQANFTSGTSFNAPVLLLQGDRTTIATAAQVNNSTLTVTFNDGSTARAAVHTTTLNGITTASATATTFGPLDPGYGSGSDGIHIAASGNATVNASTITNNNISGVAGFGIHVETNGAARSTDLTIANNTLQFNGIGTDANFNPVFTGGGISVQMNGTVPTAEFDVLMQSNTVTSNFNNGINVSADGYGTMNVNSLSNNLLGNSTDPTNPTGNGGNAFNVSSNGNATLNFNSSGNQVSGNGIGSAVNPSLTGGDNIAVSAGGNSTANYTFHGLTSNNAGGSGLSATSRGRGILNLIVDNNSTFTANEANGIQLASNDTSLLNVNISKSAMDSNGENGIGINRYAGSLILANISNSTMNSNASNGLFFLGLGSDPTNPNQQQTGTANTINIINSSMDGNGIDGARMNAYGQSVEVMNVLNSSFNNNLGNGFHIDMAPGAAFGNVAANIASTFDHIEATGNGANGIFLSSQVTNAPLDDAESGTLFNINSVHGDTVISNNGNNGFLMQMEGGVHNVTIQSDGNVTPVHQTVIQSNRADGIHVDVGNFGNVTLNANSILIGGTAAQGNGGDGIDFDVVLSRQLTAAQLNSSDPNTVGLATFMTEYEHAGIGTLNVNNTTISNNKGNGIQLYYNSLLGDGFNPAEYATRTTTRWYDGYGQINANVTNSTIVNNGQSGVRIELLGHSGGDRWSRYGGQSGINTFNFTGNVISNNGTYGLFFESNPGLIQDQRQYGFFSPPDPPGSSNVPLNPVDYVNSTGGYAMNYGASGIASSKIKDGFLLSNWMNLATVSNSQLFLTNNKIKENGQNQDINNADGIKLRIGTGSYLAADLQGNDLRGNVGSSIRTESFIQYNQTNGAVLVQLPSVKGSLTTPSQVELDPTAQLDLRMNNNIGNTANFVNPMTNLSGGLLGSDSPNGAVWIWEGLKDPFDTRPPGFPRLAQLFQIDDAFNVNSNNSFISSISGVGVTQDLQAQLYDANYYLRPTAAGTFPNPVGVFPSDASTNPGDPFAN
ncbi:beta strand repeat-containing protein [Schlesneria paludicola]|uniref:beta strand repeat-containing protein n=1 Tax=Schlesneria paludicola TaxID=360056 RepID=UPI000299F845|nr:hypothetical protein [Schlesneria paludicola]